MVRKILDFINKLFTTSTQRKLTIRHADLIRKIQSARTLRELAHQLTRIKQFRRQVEDIGSPDWAVQLHRSAEQTWNVRFKHWKTRG